METVVLRVSLTSSLNSHDLNSNSLISMFSVSASGSLPVLMILIHFWPRRPTVSDLYWSCCLSWTKAHTLLCNSSIPRCKISLLRISQNQIIFFTSECLLSFSIFVFIVSQISRSYCLLIHHFLQVFALCWTEEILQLPFGFVKGDLYILFTFLFLFLNESTDF